MARDPLRRVRVRREQVKPLDLLVDSLAVYRLTRLVTTDVLTEGPRRALVEAAFEQDGDTFAVLDGETTREAIEAVRAAGRSIPKAAVLITCRWCASPYVAALVVLARGRLPRLWSPLAKVLAYGAVAGLLASLEED